MDELLQNNVFVAGTLIAGALVMIAWRFRETRNAVSARKIVVPPLAMSSGFAMFLVPDWRIAWSWALLAFLLGALVFWYPLSRSSTLERAGDSVVLRRSRAFLAILLGLVAVRFVMRGYIDDYVTVQQTGALFFLLAFGMVVRWRVGMLVRYCELRAEIDALCAPREPPLPELREVAN
jgi:membrane protein CcdC involved in cytochrome C biogenesis